MRAKELGSPAGLPLFQERSGGLARRPRRVGTTPVRCVPSEGFQPRRGDPNHILSLKLQL